MILGVLVITVLLVIRLNAPSLPPLPDTITLPDGTRPTAFTRGRNWIAVTTDDQILIYNLDGSQRQIIDIE